MRKLEEAAASFALREMVEADLEKVAAIEARAFRSPWSLELLRRELTHDWSCALLVEEPSPTGGWELLGFSIFWIVQDELHVLNVATAEEHRRRGVARFAMEATLQRGREKGCRMATLEVRRDNESARALYENLGFLVVGVRPGYYQEEQQDAIIMTRDL